MERCPQCGQPKYVCQNEDPDVAFSVNTEVCFATQARERAEKSRTNNGKKSMPAGTTLAADPYTYSRMPLDKLREPFYLARAKEYEQKVKERPVRTRDDGLDVP